MSDNDTYCRKRIEEELAAAERATDLSISQIHRELARRYRDMLNSQADPVNMGAIMAEAWSGAIDKQGSVTA